MGTERDDEQRPELPHQSGVEHDGHTIDIGHVHVKEYHGGPCTPECPHPDHKFHTSADGHVIEVLCHTPNGPGGRCVVECPHPDHQRIVGVPIDPEDPAASPADWAHYKVHGKYPAGTDPRDALREVADVFFERTDGTNALPWWQRVGVRWWHAGPGSLKRGGEVLPPSQTGVVPVLDTSDRNSVYLTTSREEAILYCTQLMAGSGAFARLYEVSFHEEPQPDDTQPESTTSFRVPSATIRRVEVPSKRELSDALELLLDVHQAQMGAKVIAMAEEAAREAAGE